MNWEMLLIALGLVLIIEGLPYFLFPERVVNVLRQLEALEPRTLRRLGLASLMAGVGLLLVGQWIA